MIKRLRERRQYAQVRSEARAERRRVGRWVYLALLVVFFAWLFNAFAGGLFWLRAEGMVLRQPQELSVEYVGTVTDLSVRAGAGVERGQLLARVSSQEVLEELASLSADYSGVLARQVELRVRQEVNEALLETAKTRLEETTQLRKNMLDLGKSGIVTQGQVLQALEDHYRSLQDLRRMQAELRVLREEQERLLQSLDRTRAAIEALERRYDDGALRAPVSGVVGELAVREGSVVRAGDPVLRIYTGEPFILVYLPTGALYDVAPGELVYIRAGLRRYTGKIRRIWPVAGEIPPEFQKSFAPRERGQLAEVSFSEAAELPLFSTVSISGTPWLAW